MSTKKGSTDVKEYFHIWDTTDNTPKTGLTFESPGGVASYIRNGEESVSFALATLGSASANHSDGGFIEVDVNKDPGTYRVDPPDAAYASGVPDVIIKLLFDDAYIEGLRVGLVDNTAKDIHDIVDHPTYGNEVIKREARNIAGIVRHLEGPSLPLGIPFYWDAVNGNDGNDGLTPETAKLTFTATLGLCTAHNHDSVVAVNTTVAPLIIDIKVDVDVANVHFVGDRYITLKPTSSGASTVILSAEGTHIDGFNVETHTAGNESAIEVTADDCSVHNIKVPYCRASAIVLNGTLDCSVHDIILRNPGVGGNGHGVQITGVSSGNRVHDFDILGAAGDGINLNGASVTENTIATGDGSSIIHECGGYGIREQGGAFGNEVVGPGMLIEGNTLGKYFISDTTKVENVGQYATIDVNYNGGIWVDYGASNENTAIGVDGLEKNPVSTLVAGRTLADAIGVKKYYITGSSAVTLTETHQNWLFVGVDRASIVNLGGQDVDNSIFVNLSLAGTQGGSTYIGLMQCCLTSLLALRPWARECWIAGNITILPAAMIIFDHCSSGVAGNLTPELTFTAGVTNVNCRHKSGGIKLIDMTSQHTMSYEGDGQIIVDATCNSGNITARGNMDITDNGTAMNITQTAVYNTGRVRDSMKLDATAGAPAAGSIDTHLDDLIAMIGAFTGTSDNTILGFLRAIMRKDVSAPSGVGGTYDPSLHSNEAILETGNADWITGGTGGGGANNFDITIKKDNTSGPTLAGIDVQVMDSGETTTLTRQITNTAGGINVDLDNGTYKVYLRGSGYQVPTPGNPITLTVTGATDQEEYMEAFDPGAPAAVDLCRVTNWHIDGSGVAEVGKTWKAKVTVEPTISGDSVVSYKLQTSTASDATGFNYLDLIRTAVYEVNIDGNKYPITVPDLSTKKLKYLITA